MFPEQPLNPQVEPQQVIGQSQNAQYGANFFSSTQPASVTLQPHHQFESYPLNDVYQEDKEKQSTKLNKFDKIEPKRLTPSQKPSLRKSVTMWGTPGRYPAGITFFGWISILSILGIMIGLMVFHFADKDLKLTSVSGGLDYIAFNLDSIPIISVSPAGYDGSCANGYESVHLGRWPGTQNGCKCPGFDPSVGSCSRKEELVCSDVSDIDSIDMFNWDGSVWCVKRAQLGSEYVKSPTCPQGFKECSTSICFVNTMDCPVTSISLEATGNSSQQLSNSGRYITEARITGTSPLIDFDISLNDLPCFSMNEVPAGEGSYPLLKLKPNGCGSYGVDNTFSFMIDITTQDQVFTSNNFPSSVLNLPNYREVFQKTPTLLSGRRRILVANKDACLNINTQSIRDAGVAANDLNRFVTGTSITAMVIHGTLFVFAAFVMLGIKKGNSWKDVLQGKEAGVWLAMYIPLGACEIIVFIVMTVLVRSARSTMVNTASYLIALDGAGCFSVGPAGQVIADYDNLVDETANKLNSFASALLGISLATYIPVVFLIKAENRRKRSKIGI